MRTEHFFNFLALFPKMVSILWHPIPTPVLQLCPIWSITKSFLKVRLHQVLSFPQTLEIWIAQHKNPFPLNKAGCLVLLPSSTLGSESALWQLKKQKSSQRKEEKDCAWYNLWSTHSSWCNDLELAQCCRVWCLSHTFFVRQVLAYTCQRELLRKGCHLALPAHALAQQPVPKAWIP